MSLLTPEKPVTRTQFQRLTTGSLVAILLSGIGGGAFGVYAFAFEQMADVSKSASNEMVFVLVSFGLFYGLYTVLWTTGVVVSAGVVRRFVASKVPALESQKLGVGLLFTAVCFFTSALIGPALAAIGVYGFVRAWQRIYRSSAPTPQ